MNTQQRIDKITEELRDIYLTTNEGPRLIAEMVEREFPRSLELAMIPITENLEGESESLRGEVGDLEDQIDKLGSTIDALESTVEALRAELGDD
jgi:hypothetical protein